MAAPKRKRVSRGSVTRTGRTWRAEVRINGERLTERGFMLEADGWAWIDEQKRAAHLTGGRRSASITFEELFAEALEAGGRGGDGLAVSTRHDYAETARRWILPYLGAELVGDVSRRRYAAWLLELRKAGAPKAQRAKAHRIAARTFAHGVDMEYLPAGSPALRQNAAPRADKAERYREPNPLRVEELEALAREVRPEYRALVMTLGLVGLRISEAVALTRDDYDSRTRTLSITKAITEVGGALTEPHAPKSAAGSRRVVVPPVLAEELEAHLAEYVGRFRTSPLFPNADGGVMGPGNVRNRIIREAATRLGLRLAERRRQDGRRVVESTLGNHDLRHTAASIAYRAGATDHDVQRMLGHANPSITRERYIHRDDADARGVADAIGEAFTAARRGRLAVVER